MSREWAARTSPGSSPSSSAAGEKRLRRPGPHEHPRGDLPRGGRRGVELKRRRDHRRLCAAGEPAAQGAADRPHPDGGVPRALRLRHLQGVRDDRPQLRRRAIGPSSVLHRRAESSSARRSSASRCSASLFLATVLAIFFTHAVVRGDAERGLLQPLVVRPVGSTSRSRRAFPRRRVRVLAYVAVVYTACFSSRTA